MRRSAEIIVKFAYTLGASSIILATTAYGAAPPATPKSHRFKVDNATFSGSAKLICVIEGKWRDGEPFRYEAWDACSKMRMRRPSMNEYKSAHSLGVNNDYSVVDIPDEGDVVEVSNESSSVLLFRDKDGVMREILSRD